MPRWPAQSFPVRFWTRVAQQDAGCWDWLGACNPDGYGVVRGPRREWLLAHRVAYALARGPIPAGAYVLHACDRPCCCHPFHLSLGTAEENLRDQYERGRRLVRLRPAQPLTF